MELLSLQSFIIALGVGVASGAIGSFIILKRMALVGDALSHVALPGIALALFYNIDPFWGTLIFLILSAIFVWGLEIKTKLPTEALVGLLFTASLAIGILTIPNTEILESLFGAFPSLSFYSLIIFSLTAIFSIVLTFVLAKKFLFRIIADDLAKASGIDLKYDLILLILFSVIVTLGIKLVGALLMGTLVIIPSLIAKNFASSMKEYLISSAILGGIIATVGIFISQIFGFLPGPAITLLGAIIFLLTLPFMKR